MSRCWYWSRVFNSYGKWNIYRICMVHCRITRADAYYAVCLSSKAEYLISSWYLLLWYFNLWTFAFNDVFMVSETKHVCFCNCWPHGMFLPWVLLLEYCICHVTEKLLYVKSVFSTSKLDGVSQDYPSLVWGGIVQLLSWSSFQNTIKAWNFPHL